MNHKILAINPGSTSTKIAVYQNAKPVFLKSILHDPKELSKYKRISDQYEFRKNIILKELKDSHIGIETIEVVVGRGGLIRPIESGVYNINERLRTDLLEGVMGEHASNLGGLIAHDIARDLPNCRAFIADPVVVDELLDERRQFIEGVFCHSLNSAKSPFSSMSGSLPGAVGLKSEPWTN